MTKMVLDNKKAEYEYKLLSSFSQEEQDFYLDIAREARQMSFPLIIKDGKIITLQEV